MKLIRKEKKIGMKRGRNEHGRAEKDKKKKSNVHTIQNNEPRQRWKDQRKEQM